MYNLRKVFALLLIAPCVLMGGCGALEVSETMTVTAHTGALGTKDNTLASAKAGLDCVGDSGCIEVDVRFLADGTPVLGHDEVNAQSPKLEDVFKLMQDGKAGINLDLKEHDPNNIERVAELAKKYGLEKRAFFTGVSKENLSSVVGLGLDYYLNCEPTEKDAISLLEYTKLVGAAGININKKLCTQQLVSNTQEMGLKISVYTVRSRIEMRRLIGMGVDNITTRRPDVLLRMISNGA